MSSNNINKNKLIKIKSKLTKKFFTQPTLDLATQLLGKVLVFKKNLGIITETEAYIGEDDPACHAARGRTNRTEVMYKNAGYSYVYLIYGMYHCLNIVTEKLDFPAAILIRGVLTNVCHFNGPGKLCKHFGITTQHNNINLINSDYFYIADLIQPMQFKYIATPRIGIKVGLDKLWRFKMQHNLIIT